MAAPPLPDFERTLALGHGSIDAGGLAECHGVACGLLVRRPDSDASVLLQLLAMLQIVEQPGEALCEALVELQEATAAQLVDEMMGLVIWLPEDESPLEDRTDALAQWCNGFLAGLGAGGEDRLDTLSPEAGEALADLQEIALAEVSSAEGGQAEEAREDEERAFAEIVEYIRIAVLMLREDLRGPAADDSIH